MCDEKGESRTGLSVNIKSARFVSLWKWNVADADEVCGVCRLPFERGCPECKFPGDECPTSVGGCKHVFHLHCIMRWLQSDNREQVCPLCRRPWD